MQIVQDTDPAVYALCCQKHLQFAKSMHCLYWAGLEYAFSNCAVQVEARLQDKDALVLLLQQATQAAQKQQAQDRQDLIAGNALQGQLQGQVSSLSRCA